MSVMADSETQYVDQEEEGPFSITDVDGIDRGDVRMSRYLMSV